jgi:hypothetical protein
MHILTYKKLRNVVAVHTASKMKLQRYTKFAYSPINCNEYGKMLKTLSHIILALHALGSRKKRGVAHGHASLIFFDASGASITLTPRDAL